MIFTNFRIELPKDDFDTLVNVNNVFYKEDEIIISDDNSNLTRAVSWMINCDCAILTAWRSSKTRSENDSNNHDLQLALRKYGYGVTKVRGCYTELGKPTSKENSFLVFNLEKDKSFYDNVYLLAENYEQDCFLFKPAGRTETAYLIGTNDAFIQKNGNKKIAGTLKISPVDPREYSAIGSGVICFE